MTRFGRLADTEAQKKTSKSLPSGIPASGLHGSSVPAA
jgi:hypothetical protein